MTWQEELSHLDAALASGQISADDYRRERERILAVAAGGSGSSTKPGPQPSGGAEQQQPPADQGAGAQGAGAQGEGRSAFPPPFRWTTERPDDQNQPRQPAPREQPQTDANADQTQIVPQPETTQVVGSEPGGERTQVVHPVSPAQGVPQWQPQPYEQWGAPPGPPQPGPWGESEELVSPWAGYHPQGPEVFEVDAKSGKGKIFAIVGVVVLLLAIAGGILWLTVFKDSNEAQPPTNQTSSAAQPTTTSKAPEAYGPLHVPKGRSAGGKTYSAEELSAAKALPTPDLVLLKQAGLTEARSVIVVDGSTTISLWSFSTGDAKALEESITTDQQRFGFKEVGTKDGVKVFASQQQSANRTVHVRRAHYVNGNDVIRVEAFDPDEVKASDLFEATLAAQLEQTRPE